MPKEDGWKNLIPMNQRPKEEQDKIREKALQANKEYYERQRTAKEVARQLLNLTVTKTKQRNILGEEAESLQDNASMLEVLTMRQILEAQQGSTKAYEVIRDTAGYKPVEEIQQNVNIITEADKALLEKVAKRTGIPADTSQ